MWRCRLFGHRFHFRAKVDGRDLFVCERCLAYLGLKYPIRAIDPKTVRKSDHLRTVA